MHIILECKKCEHQFYIEHEDVEVVTKTVDNIFENGCYNCGEEMYGNLILLKMTSEK